MSKLLLGGATLHFYQWEGVSNVSKLGDPVKKKIDAMALAFTDEERERCISETENCFTCGEKLTSYLRPRTYY
jgi:heme oxygenase